MVRQTLAENPKILERTQLRLIDNNAFFLARNESISERVQLEMINNGSYSLNDLSRNKNLCKDAQKEILNKVSRITTIENLIQNPNLCQEAKDIINNREYIFANEIYKDSRGYCDNVAITALFVKVGDKVKKGQKLLTHEYSEGGTSERLITSNCNGTVEKILRKVGKDDKDNNYSIIMIIKKDNA